MKKWSLHKTTISLKKIVASLAQTGGISNKSLYKNTVISQFMLATLAHLT